MNLILNLGAGGQIAFVVIAFGGGSVAGLYLVRRLVSLEKLQRNHEVAGVTFGVLGAFYGLVLAFMMSAAWQRFNQATANVHDEATSLESLYKVAAAFPDPIRSRMESQILEYADRVVNQEWPRMATFRYEGNREGAHLLWTMILSYRPTDAREQMLIEKSLEELDLVSRARSQRLMFYDGDLPPVVWLVIYMGCFITIGFSYFFGNSAFRPQIVMCAVFSILIGLTIVAIVELAHPYQGSVTISDDPFRYAISRMHALRDYESPSIAPSAPNAPVK
jgi:hypothetical protein